MDEHSVHDHLLRSKSDEFVHSKNTLFLVSSAKWVLKFSMWAIFISWAALIFLLPSEFVHKLYQKCIVATNGTLFGITGSIFLIFSGPILIISFLAIAYLIISGDEKLQEKKSSKIPCFRLWTFPVIVDGPFGVVSAGELIGIKLFSVYIIWAVYAYIIQDLSILSKLQLSFKEERSLMMELIGLRFGSIGLYCLAFLFLPVSRGSVLLRLIDIPFEHATRYHVWLGHLTMMLFTLHGLFNVIAWQMQGRLLHEILNWKSIGIANLPGVISLAAGLLMWVTSLPPVRKQNFELFFYTHQLYVVFVIFFAMHVGDFIFSIAAGGILLFILDRFLRFCQSRAPVEVLSAKCLPCGTVELVFSKPANLKYNALSFIFLQVRELAFLQWHPFSVSSSPLEGKYHISVLIKVLGEWTEKLRESILNVSEESQAKLILQPHSNITAYVEGPYGHELPYHLTYENLILIAGGIGISPFIAILSDVLHRINNGKPCLPKNILIVWAVKRSNELPLLHAFDMESICPIFSDKLNLEIQTYVTRESEPPLEEGKVLKSTNSFDHLVSNKGGISVLVGTGNIMWAGIYVMVSTVGFIISVGLLNIWYINPFGISYWWYKGLLFMACMVGSVFIFGGLVVGLWHVWERKNLARKKFEDDGKKTDSVQSNEPVPNSGLGEENLVCSNNIRYGIRPDFKEIFNSISESWGLVDIGVIVCGPPTLQSSVAKECRSQSLKRSHNHPIFHFNSHSFDL